MTDFLEPHPKAAAQLASAGVQLPDPRQVFVDRSVDLARIAPDTVLYPGTRLAGRELSLGPGCRIGTEGPATLVDAQLGARVQVASGYVAGSVLLDDSALGYGSHVRPGCLLEEQASTAHAVGLKQTILLPFVTLGSLINFCDVLMAGGTSRKEHSEVGSSYIHFNFTPHGDKATASLVGEVPSGILLRRHPIFLGGQGGMVGPTRVAYGTVVAAGTVLREDVDEDDQLYLGGMPGKSSRRPLTMGRYRKVDRIVRNNLAYIGNLMALEHWYRYVRMAPKKQPAWTAACHHGALRILDAAVAERLKRLRAVAERMTDSLEGVPEDRGHDLRRLARDWARIEQAVTAGIPEETGSEPREAFLAAWGEACAAHPGDYLEAVRSLSDAQGDLARQWLEQVVDRVVLFWQT